MAAPTFVQEAETTWNSSSTPRTTSSVDVQAGDVLVGLAAKANDLNPALALTSGGSLTWTNRQIVNPDPQSGLWSTLRIDTASVDSNKSMTVSFSKSGSSSVLFGGNALTFRGSDGIGASSSDNVSNGAPSLGITTTEDDSAVAVVVVDWNASDGASRVWRQVNGASPVEVTYFRDSDEYTVYAAYYANVGTAGAKTVGLSAPSGQKYAIAAVEILGAEDSGGGDFVAAWARNSNVVIQTGR